MPPSTAVLLLEGLSFVFSTKFSDFINAVCFFPSFWYRYNVIMILRWGLICGAGLNDTLIVFYYLLYHCSNPLIYLQDLMSVSFKVSCTSAGASIVHTQPHGTWFFVNLFCCVILQTAEWVLADNRLWLWTYCDISNKDMNQWIQMSLFLSC